MTNSSRLEIDGDDALRHDAPLAHALSNGRLTTLISAAGAGGTRLGALALTRWTPDRTRDADGYFVYLRDAESGSVWSVGARPVRGAPSHYAVRFGDGRMEIARTDHDIESLLEVCVAPEHDVELRRITLTNASDRPRTIELTTYLEAALNTPAGDASHPAFSKLFVQTAYDEARDLLLAWRRLRSPDDVPLWIAHGFWAEQGGVAERAEYETNRARFIGRGRSLAHPLALDGGRLSGNVGNVLDPVLALRRRVTLAPGASARFVAVLAAAVDRDGVDALTSRYADAGGGAAAPVEEAFDGAAARAREVLGDVASSSFAALGALAYAHPGAGDVSAWRSAHDDRALFALASHVRVAHHAAGSHATHDRRTPADARAAGSELAVDESLQFFNGHGGFSADGTEYVIRMPGGTDGPMRPPLPWANVVANERVGFIATESGASNTWSANSRENRLTPWLNDPVSDATGEALYLRDDETGACWSPTPGSRPSAGAYEARHGFGYSTWRHAGDGLATEVTAFVPRHDPVKLTRVRITNTGDRPRRITAFSYAQLVLGVLPWETAPNVETRLEDGAIFATNASRAEFSSLVTVATAVGPVGADWTSCTADRAEFLGPLGDLESPAALGARALSGRTGAGLDPCAAFATSLEIAPGSTVDCVFLLGEARDEDEAHGLLAQYRDEREFDVALDEVRHFWRETLGAVQIQTPSPALDLMVNGWLSYQNLACRVWGRSAYYQSGGAFGFRDQLQDCASLLHLAPRLTRDQIVLHASHQFAEGDVLHWWHPPASKGIRTRFSDDLLWLPFVTAYYVESTGDASVLDESARFLTAPPLPDGEDEVFVFPEDSGEQGSVYEHCRRALDRSLTVGAHGLPLMGTGDWNDGMNRVGREGRGESVWLGFFLAHILQHFIPICEQRGDDASAERYRAYLAELSRALDADGAGWDGGWYRRAYYDDGSPLGAASNDECRIDTIAQAWAVISRVAPPARAEQALDAMERELVSESEGIIRLLTPAFDRTPHDPGYIKGYLPGVRENGGQYTHGALWAVKALAELGRGERAARLLEMLSPVSHGRTSEEVEVYRTEPYVIAADVYGVAPHVGHGGWTWYTGSAGWMFRIALESVLGLTIDGGTHLVLKPCIPRAWPGFTVRYRLPDGDTTYEIVVTRTEGDSSVASPNEIRDGAVRIPIVGDGATHRVEIALGDDVGPRYASSSAEPFVRTTSA